MPRITTPDRSGPVRLPPLGGRPANPNAALCVRAMMLGTQLEISRIVLAAAVAARAARDLRRR